MLGLQLRREFQTAQMRGTMIELRRKDKSGAAELPARDILEITYPTADVRSALTVLAASQGRPIVLIGDRGRGKSHILAVLHHALQSPDVVEQWAAGWVGTISDARFTALKLPRNFHPITEVMSDQEYSTLWDLIFAEHPDGKLYQGRFIQAGTQIPSRSLMEEMFEKCPTALILDELQSWYDGLSDEPGEGGPKLAKRTFNFIQILSEIAHDRPDALLLIASVRTNQTEAFRQIHRVNPVLVDFCGPTAKEDRKRLILHRLFENRAQIGDAGISPVARAYAAERRRLLFEQVAGAEHSRLDREVVECWPFGPELLDLLEDHVLMSSAAQETRDLIKILAQLFRARGEAVPLLSAADFYVDDDTCGVASLLNSISTAGIHDQLREFANRNLEAIRDAGVTAPHARELISAIWVHSLAPDEARGATAQQLQLTITRDAAIDDNAFAEEMGRVADNAFKIHRELTGKRRFYLSLEDNAETKLKASARNDKVFEGGQDKQFLRDTLTHLLASPDATTQAPCRVIVLDGAWENAPWANVKEADRPDRWDRQVLLVVPDPIGHPAEVLGPWLAANVQQRRNTIRFLLPRTGHAGLYADAPLLFLARCASLAKEWRKTDGAYSALHGKYDGELRKQLGERFDRVAVISRWNFQSPKSCEFHVETLGQTGARIPAEVERIVRENLFDQTEFSAHVITAAASSQLVKDLLTHLREPPVKPEQDAIAYLGDTAIYEQVLRLAAQGKIAVNAGNRWYIRQPADASEDAAYQRIRLGAFRTGREMEDVQLGTPATIGGGGVTVVTPPTPPEMPPVGPGPGPGEPPTPPVGPGPGPGPLFPPTAPPIVKKSDFAKTGVNLLGDVERWQILDGQRVLLTKLTVKDISKDELKTILQRLPPKIRAELEVELPGEGSQ